MTCAGHFRIVSVPVFRVETKDTVFMTYRRGDSFVVDTKLIYSEWYEIEYAFSLKLLTQFMTSFVPKRLSMIFIYASTFSKKSTIEISIDIES